MSNDPPPPGPDEDPAGQGNQPPPPPPPSEPQWNPQSGAGQEGYGQQPPGYPPPGAPGGYGQAPAQNSPLAIVSLVLGIVGFLCCGLFLFSVGALITGFLARKQIAESQGRLKGAGMATAGLILGAVAIVVGIIYWVLIVAGAFDSNMYVDSY